MYCGSEAVCQEYPDTHDVEGHEHIQPKRGVGASGWGSHPEETLKSDSEGEDWPNGTKKFEWVSPSTSEDEIERRKGRRPTPLQMSMLEDIAEYQNRKAIENALPGVPPPEPLVVPLFETVEHMARWMEEFILKPTIQIADECGPNKLNNKRKMKNTK